MAYEPASEGTIIVAGTSGIAPNGESTGNVIDGGAGDDHIYAGSGADIVLAAGRYGQGHVDRYRRRNAAVSLHFMGVA